MGSFTILKMVSMIYAKMPKGALEIVVVRLNEFRLAVAAEVERMKAIAAMVKITIQLNDEITYAT